MVLRQEDLARLTPGGWLNDKGVELGMDLTERLQLTHKGRRLTHRFSTFFLSRLMGDREQSMQELTKGFSRVRRWCSKVDVFSKSLLLFPLHVNGHWSLVAVLNPAAAARRFRAMAEVQCCPLAEAADLEAALVQTVPGPYDAEHEPSAARRMALKALTDAAETNSDPRSFVNSDPTAGTPLLAPMPPLWLPDMDEPGAAVGGASWEKTFSSRSGRASSSFASAAFGMPVPPDSDDDEVQVLDDTDSLLLQWPPGLHQKLHKLLSWRQGDDGRLAECCIVHCDSMSSHDTVQCTTAVRFWLVREWERRRGCGRKVLYGRGVCSPEGGEPSAELAMTLLRRGWSLSKVPLAPSVSLRVPQQDNTCDCGVYTARFGRALLVMVGQWAEQPCDVVHLPEVPLGLRVHTASLRAPNEAPWAAELRRRLQVSWRLIRQSRLDLLVHALHMVGGTVEQRLRLSELRGSRSQPAWAGRESDSSLLLGAGESPGRPRGSHAPQARADSDVVHLDDSDASPELPPRAAAAGYDHLPPIVSL